MRAKVSAFIRRLAAAQAPGIDGAQGGWFNPWAQTCPELDAVDDAPAARRARLSAHLLAEDVVAVLIGEAPGFQGCRFSGIGFVSERLLLEGAIPRVPPPPGRITRRVQPFSEPSATIVWGILRELGIEHRTILFNAFPFHPFKAEGPLTNRTPTPAELALGQPFLEELLALYPQAQVVAVGRKAETALDGLGRPFTRVRHPANGGGTAFRQGLRELFGSPEQPWVT